MRDRVALLLIQPRAEEGEQREPLAVGAAVNQRFVRADPWRRDRAWRPDRATEIRPIEAPRDSLDSREVERFVALDRSAQRPAKLLAVELVERAAVAERARQPFATLEVEQAPVAVVRARLPDHGDDAARRTT